MGRTWTEYLSESGIGVNVPTGPSDVQWYRPEFPSWVTEFRPSQLEAVSDIVGHFRSGKRVVILEAPTGTGKTLIGDMVRRMLGSRTLYVCTTKTLQRQFVTDFDYAVEIKGRNNYPTQLGPRYVTCADCTWPGIDEQHPSCQWCKDKWACPYEVAKRQALLQTTDMAVANTAYFLTEANYIGQFSGWDGTRTLPTPFGLVIVDEADALEGEVMGHVEFRLGKRLVDELMLEPPGRKTQRKEEDTIEWVEWANEVGLPRLRRATDQAEVMAMATEEVRDYRRYRSLRRHVDRLEQIKDDLGSGWVYTGYDRDEIAFRPVYVRDIGEQTIWRHAQRFLLMSATVVSAAQMATDLGLEPSDWASVTVGSGFDPARRPIVIDSESVSMSNAEKETAWPAMAERVCAVLAMYPGRRTLVHTVSYRLANFLADELQGLGRAVLIYRQAKERTAVLEDFHAIEGAVLIAPSLDRGIDLPDDLCRLIIVAKVPFPNLGDKQVAGRLHSPGGKTWYAVQAIRSLIQMTGRAMRTPDDWSDVWVLDKQFVTNVWRKHKDLLPKWWRDAIVWHSGILKPVDERHADDDLGIAARS